jgi:hypothetical protein
MHHGEVCRNAVAPAPHRRRLSPRTVDHHDRLTARNGRAQPIGTAAQLVPLTGARLRAVQETKTATTDDPLA